MNPRQHVRRNLLAFVWGVSEAVVFFVVPDVLITRAALVSARLGLITMAFVLAGALLGGAFSYLWGAGDLPGARHLLDWLPAISIDMLDHAQHALAMDGVFAALVGSFSGVPYKVYAVHAASAGIPLTKFLLASVPARGIRFALLVLITRGLVRYAVPNWSAARLRLAWAFTWIGFYAVYWGIMPN